MQQTQTLTVTLTLKKTQSPYSLLEGKGIGKRKYNALKHFFEDIGYKVQSITSETVSDASRAVNPVSEKCATFADLLETLENTFQVTGNNPLEDSLDRVSFEMPDGLPITSWHVQSKGNRVTVTVSDSEE